MLADSLLLPDSHLEPVLRPWVLEAQKFNIGMDVMDLVAQLGTPGVEPMADLCRLPYPTTWLEFPLKRPEAVDRMVTLLRQPDRDEPLVWDMWALRLSAVGDQPVGGQFLALRIGRQPGAWVIAAHQGGPEYLCENDNPNAFGGATDDKGQLVMRSTRVFRLVQGVLTILGAKGATVTEYHPTQPRLNKARAKLGRPPLVDYHLLRLDLGKAGADRRGGGHTGRTVRGHAVRGHMVRRGSTIYWRRAHMRGDLTKGFAAKRYDAHMA
jgi:hypothetical protein